MFSACLQTLLFCWWLLKVLWHPFSLGWKSHTASLRQCKCNIQIPLAQAWQRARLSRCLWPGFALLSHSGLLGFGVGQECWCNVLCCQHCSLEGLEFQAALSESRFFRIQLIYNSSQSVLRVFQYQDAMNNLCYSTTDVHCFCALGGVIFVK